MVNKKALAQQAIVELILVLAGGIIGLLILMMILTPMFPTIGTIGATANVALYAAAVKGSAGVFGAPMFLANQYREPIKINAADFKACPSIAGFCKNVKTGVVRDECYKQCARIQIDKLTDACWAMGGKGQLDLKETLASKIGTGQIALEVAGVAAGHVTAIFATVAPAVGAALATPVAGPLSGFAAAAWTTAMASGGYSNIQQAVQNWIIPKRSVIFRCNKFQIINPALDSYSRPFVFEDASLGDSPYALQGEVCKKFGLNSPCYLGGQGVAAARLDDETHRAEIDLLDLIHLQYAVSQPRQVCYISYYQYFNEQEHKRHAVVRDCGSWHSLGGNFKYLN